MKKWIWGILGLLVLGLGFLYFSNNNQGPNSFSNLLHIIDRGDSAQKEGGQSSSSNPYHPNTQSQEGSQTSVDNNSRPTGIGHNNINHPNQQLSASSHSSQRMDEGGLLAIEQAPKLNSKEIESIQTIIALGLRESVSTNFKPANLLANLKKMGLQPIVAQDFNPDTGKLVITRTKNTIDGISNFHSQVFQDESQEAFAQHTSFNIRPAKDSKEIATKMLQKVFGVSLGKPSYERPDFTRWSLPNGNVAWIKVMSAEDLKENRFNAYDPVKDLGTLWVAIEQNPHDDDGGDDHTH